MNIDDVPKDIPMPMIETPYPAPEHRVIVRGLSPVLSWGRKTKGIGLSLVVRGVSMDDEQELEPFALLLSRDVSEVRSIIRALTLSCDEMENRSKPWP